MKVFAVVFAVSALVAVTYGQSHIAAAGSTDIDRLLRNTPFVQKQINCVLGKGTCDKTGQQIIAALPEVLNRNCRACSPSQASNARKVISFIQQNYPSVWSSIMQRYRG